MKTVSITCMCGQSVSYKCLELEDNNFALVCKTCNIIGIGHYSKRVWFTSVISKPLLESTSPFYITTDLNLLNLYRESNDRDDVARMKLQFLNAELINKSDAIRYLINEGMIKDEFRLKLINDYL